jgi:hypothetical protein
LSDKIRALYNFHAETPSALPNMVGQSMEWRAENQAAVVILSVALYKIKANFGI